MNLIHARAKLLSTFDKTAALSRSTSTSDGLGESLTWAVVIQANKKTVFPCSVGEPGKQAAQELVEAEKLVGQKLWNIYCPVGTDVTIRDRVQVGSLLFEVKEVRGSQESNQVETTITGVLVE